MWTTLGFKTKNDMLQNRHKGREEGAMSNLRKAHPLNSHAYCKECESSATNRYRTQMGSLCVTETF